MKQAVAFDLYRLYRDELVANFNHHRETLQNYLAFSSGILGVTVVGIFQVQSRGAIGLFISAIPILNILICRLAINMCNRFYFAALERVVLSAKLEAVLGLNKKVNLGQAKIFPDDSSFLPERWLSDVWKFKTSTEFVTELSKKGVNRITRQTFNILIGINILLIVVIVFVSFA